jgi:hypothetical protein
LGSNGVPLSYVVCDNRQLDTEMTHPDFVNKTMACAQLAGEYYSANRLAVFNFIACGDCWIKNTTLNLQTADNQCKLYVIISPEKAMLLVIWWKQTS